MAKVRKHGNAWVADWTDEWGKRHRERPEGPFTSMARQKRAAHALLQKRLQESDRSSYSPINDRLTFAQAADRFLESKVNVRPTTKRSYESLINLYLKPYFGAWRLKTISPADIETFRNRMAEGYPPPILDAFAERLRASRPSLSQARARQRAARRKQPGIRTINKCLTLLVMTCNYCCRHRWIDFNPAEHVEKLKAPVSIDSELIDQNVLSPAEVAQLLEGAESAHRGRDGKIISNNYRLLIKTAVFTGLRSSEIRGLQWGDVDWHSKQLFIRRAWREGVFAEPKSQASVRRIDLPETLLSDLKEWKLACPQGEHDLVFPNLSGKPMSNTNLLQRGFYPALRRAGLRKIRFHDLRHTFASLLIANGEDVVRVSRLLGHSNPTVTLKVYSHMLPKEHYGSTDRLVELVMGKENAKEEISAT